MEARNAKSPGSRPLGSQDNSPKPTASNFSQRTDSVNGNGAQAVEPLLLHHRAMLESSGISPATMNARGYLDRDHEDGTPTPGLLRRAVPGARSGDSHL